MGVLQKKLGQKYMEESLPKLLCFLKKRLEGGKQYLVGNKVSYDSHLNIVQHGKNNFFN